MCYGGGGGWGGERGKRRDNKSRFWQSWVLPPKGQGNQMLLSKGDLWEAGPCLIHVQKQLLQIPHMHPDKRFTRGSHLSIIAWRIFLNKTQHHNFTKTLSTRQLLQVTLNFYLMSMQAQLSLPPRGTPTCVYPHFLLLFGCWQQPNWNSREIGHQTSESQPCLRRQSYTGYF